MKINKYCAVIVAGVVMMAAVVVFTTKMRDDYEKQFSVVEEQYEEGGTVEFEDSNSNKPVFDSATGKFFLPLREIVEEMGGKVEWNSEKSAVVVSLRGTEAEINEGKNEAVINGHSIYLYDAPKNINGCLYVPSDFIANNFGTIVEWDEGNKVITIKTEITKSPIININRFSYVDADMEYVVEVPVISGLNDKNYEENLNSSYVTKIMDDIKIFANQSKIEEDKTTKYYWNEKVYVKTKTSHIISFLRSGVKEEPNGVGATIMTPVTINLDKQSEMKLSDFFKNENYKSYIIDELTQMWTENPEKYPVSVSENIETTIENNFYVDGNNLVIFIKNKDGRTYSEFVIPFYDLRSYMKSDLLYLAKNINDNN